MTEQGLPYRELRSGDDLVLRRHRRDDLEEIVAQCQDPEMQRWTTVPVPYATSHAEEFLVRVDGGWHTGELAAFAVEVDGRFAGSIDLRPQEGAWAEVGFGLAPWARNAGVMTRALGLVLDWGFDELGLSGVQWRAFVGNEASRTVALRCGFVLEGTVRGLLAQRGRRFDGWIATIVAGDRVPGLSR